MDAAVVVVKVAADAEEAVVVHPATTVTAGLASCTDLHSPIYPYYSG